MSPVIIISVSQQNVTAWLLTGAEACLCCTYGLSVNLPSDVGCGPRWAGRAVRLQLLAHLVSRLRCEHLWRVALCFCAYRQDMSRRTSHQSGSPTKASLIEPQLILLSAKMCAGCSSTYSMSVFVSVDTSPGVQRPGRESDHHLHLAPRTRITGAITLLRPYVLEECAVRSYFFTRAYTQTKLNSVDLVRERTIPTERPPPVGEVSANFCG
jgi:hypothetical protein